MMDILNLVLNLVQCGLLSVFAYRYWTPSTPRQRENRKQILEELKADPKRAKAIAAYCADHPGVSFRKAAIAVQDKEQ